MAKFTDTFIRNLQTDKRMIDEIDSNGFGVRVYGTGRKVFFFQYKFDGKRRFLNLGSYDPKFEAVAPDGKKIGSLAYHRNKYIEAKNKLTRGIDPLLEKDTAKTERKRTPFVADFVNDFIEKYAKEHNRGWQEIERALKAEIVPKWGKRKLTDIKRSDLVLVLDEIKERGAPVMANRVMAYTRKMFSWAVSERAVLDVHPFLMMKRPSKEEARERSLSKIEINTFWHNLDDCKMSDHIKRALKLILVTAQRPGEIIGMHRDEIDGDWWEIPTLRSKNKLVHRVFLTATAKQLIGDAKGYIFESPHHPADPLKSPPNPGKPYEVRTMTHDIKQNLPHTPDSKVIDRLKIPHFTPHDLRRTATGLMAEAKVELEHRERVLNHKKGKLDGTYNKYEYADEKQAALETLERILNCIITGAEGPYIMSDTDKIQQKLEAWERDLVERENKLSTLRNGKGSKVVSIRSGRRKAA